MLNACREIKISIHALREEGDAGLLDDAVQVERHFYPRPPRGGRQDNIGNDFMCSIFLSTPSARRATLLGLGVYSRMEISIHALREEGDRAGKGSEPG